VTWAAALILVAAILWWCRFWLALGAGWALLKLRPSSKFADWLLRYAGS
jgi:hypothetical protein